jgi:hypothetical protein
MMQLMPWQTKVSRWPAWILAAAAMLFCGPSARAQSAPLPARPGLATSPSSALHMSGGTVSGSIFWDQGRVAYNPSVSCQSLQVELDVITGAGLQKFATTSQFQFTRSPQVGHGLGLCSYSFSRVPEGVALQVQVSVGNPFGSRVAAKGPFGAIGGLIKIPGGQCNSSSTGTTLSSTYLESGWVGCGEHAYNVNFQLVPANTMATLPRQGTMLVQQAPGTNIPSRQMLLQPNPQPGGPAQSSGMLIPAVRPATNAQPPASTNGGFTGGISPGVTAMANSQPRGGTGSNLNGGSASGAALIAFLKKQGSLKIVSGQRTHYALSPNSMRISQLRQRSGAGQISAGQTMAAPAPGIASRLSTSPAIARNLKIAYIPSNLLSPKENTWCEQQEAQGAAPAILRIDGKTTGIQYSPDPKTNPHTIVGCGFGNSQGTLNLLLLQNQTVNNGWGNSNSSVNVTLYTVKFNIQTWDDHEIVAAVDPNTSGVPDWFSDLQLEVKTKLSGYAYGGQFTALRKSVLLTSIPQKESALYQSGSPYFLSPAANYYGLDGTVAVMRQGLSGPVAGQDQFNLQLAPGFAVDSTQTDLLVSDTNANVTSQPATVNGNAITVTYPVVAVQSGNSTVYYSIYGLKVWVTGPVGMTPLTP